MIITLIFVWIGFLTVRCWRLYNISSNEPLELQLTGTQNNVRLVCLNCTEESISVYWKGTLQGRTSVGYPPRLSADQIWSAGLGGSAFLQLTDGPLQLQTTANVLAALKIDPSTTQSPPVCKAGSLHILMQRMPFIDALDSCRGSGWMLAAVNLSSQTWLKKQIWRCLGKNEHVWIAAFNSTIPDRQPCQWMSTYPGINAGVALSCEELAYPLCYDISS